MKSTILKTLFRITIFILATLSLIGVWLLAGVSNPTIGFYAQAAISVFIMIYAVAFNKIPKKIHITLYILAAIPAFFTLFLFTYGNTSNASHAEDVVIVLGAGVNSERVSRPLAHRLDTAAAYWRDNPNAYIIVCGGLGNRATITEAEAMARYLIRLGIPAEKILLEEKSTSTYENLTFAKGILDEHFERDFTAVLVTNDFHIYRAVQTARSLGIDVSRVGAPNDWYSMPVNYLREMLAVMNMWVFG